jgi:murein DD-endopeptidase MepM/ murein hydrolase activator NlpD
MRTAVLVVLLTVLVPAPAAATAEPVVRQASVALWTSPLGDLPRVTRPFDPPDSPYGPGHRGVDLAGSLGSAVRAAGDGVVVFAGIVAGRPVVSVDHAGGLRTTYEPVDPSIGAGARVGRGSVLGVLVTGHAGCPVAACLHWGLRRGETYLDPLELLHPPRIRLLPWNDDG